MLIIVFVTSIVLFNSNQCCSEMLKTTSFWTHQEKISIFPLCLPSLLQLTLQPHQKHSNAKTSSHHTLWNINLNLTPIFSWKIHLELKKNHLFLWSCCIFSQSAKPRNHFLESFIFYIKTLHPWSQQWTQTTHRVINFPTQTQNKSIKNEKKENPFNYWTMLPNLEKKTVYDLIISF